MRKSDRDTLIKKLSASLTLFHSQPGRIYASTGLTRHQIEVLLVSLGWSIYAPSSPTHVPAEHEEHPA